MPKKTIAELQAEIDDLKSNFDDLREKDSRLYKEISRLAPKNKPWYKSLAVWIAIFLTIATLYLCYVFISSEYGKNIQLPEFLNYEIKLK